MAGVSRSGDKDIDNTSNGKRPSYKLCLSTSQTTMLENFFKECQHPNQGQKNQLAQEVGLEPKKIHFWFQNKRTQLKNQQIQTNIYVLRAENESLQNENILIRDKLNSTICSSCKGIPFPQKQHEIFMQKMVEENAQVEEELKKVSTVLARYIEKNISFSELELALAHIKASSHHSKLLILQSQAIDGSLNHNHGMLVNEPNQNCEVEKSMISKIASIAMDELIRLVRINEPFWINSSSVEYGKFTLSRGNYEKFFPKENHLKHDNVVEESSKYSAMLVNISGMQIIDMFLDSVKWTNCFPTIVTKSKTIKVFETGSLGNRDGALQLMYEQMHIMSPLVRPREFNIIRYCKQLDVGVWVITDVSYDSSKPDTNPHFCWKLPSGCMIREIPNEGCMVTWVEHVKHVKVDDEFHTHYMYKYLIGTYNLYGAESWIRELQRSCEKATSFHAQSIPAHEFGGVIQTLEGRKNVMKLANQMVKMFCESLAMSSNMEFPNIIGGIGGIKVFVNESTFEGQPNRKIIGVSSTLWIPLPAENVFGFLIDPANRSKWDAHSYGNPMNEIAHISNGLSSRNMTSIIKSFFSSDDNVILQENFISPMGSYAIYAPTNVTYMNLVLRGEDPRGIQILPSGFVVCAMDKLDENSEVGSLLTLAYQAFASNQDGDIHESIVESVAMAMTLSTTTTEKVKDALMELKCNN